MREVRVRMLGEFAVEVDGEPVAGDAWGRRRAADLVKLLALAPGGRLARDQVVELLWPHLDAEAGVANLHKAATLARKALGDRDAVVLRAGQVALAPGAELHTDVARFEDGHDPAEYGGDLLPEDRYEEWAEEPRERLREAYLRALRERGMWAELAAADPADEHAQRELMRSLAAQGNRLAARRQFRRLREALAGSGLRPDAESTALYAELARGPAAQAPLGERPPLIGRERERNLLEGAIRRADGGRGGVLLVSGLSGAGKTRIAEEALANAAERGWTTLRGSGRIEAAGATYGAIVEALERLLLDRPDLGATLPGEVQGELARLIPTFAGEPAEIDPRSDRTRIFAAVAELLAAAAREHGAALLIDDLDEAGTATLDLCAHLGAVAASERLLIILAHGEQPGGGVERARSALLGRRLAAELRLAPLGREDAAELVAQVAPVPPGAATRDGIVELAGGLPFFLCELAAAILPDGSLAIPDHLYEVVQARLGRLEAPARRALAAVAALGPSFTAEELIAVGAPEEAEAFAILDQALALGIVAERGDEYAFRQALVREALARGFPAHRVAAAHREAAGALAAGQGPPARVARHLLAAKLPREAVPWLIRGAEAAIAVAAYGDALGLVDGAIPHAGGADRGALLRMRADLLLATGDSRAPAAYAEAIAAADPRAAIELKVNQARALLAAGDVAAATGAVSGIEATSLPDRARLTFVRGMLAWFRGEIEAAREAAERARPMAIEAQLPVEIEQATQLRSAVAHSLGDWPGAIRADLRATLELPELAGAIFDAHHCSAEYELAATAPAQMRAAAGGLRDDAERSGARRAHAFAATVLGEAELAAGELGTAERRLREATDLAREVGATSSECLARLRLGEVALAGDRRAEGERRLREATELALGSAIPHHLVYLVFAARIAAARDAEALAAELTEAESLLAGAAKCAFCPMPFNVAAAVALAEAGDAERAGHYLALAEAALPLWQTGLWPPAVAEARAQAALAAGDPGRARELLAEAAAGFEAAGRPLEQAHAARRAAALAPDPGGRQPGRRAGA